VNATCRAGELAMNSSPAFYLRLFGSPSIERDGVPLAGRVAQRHRIALLALIAMAREDRLSRDKVMAYLWPESDTERGRNLLKVSTYVLRTTLGEAAVLSEGDDLRLNTDVVRVDTTEFEAALANADHVRAVALYRGPFLDGFFLSDAPEFEQWVGRERGRLAVGYAKTLEALAEEAEAARDFSTAADWWKARAAQDLYARVLPPGSCRHWKRAATRLGRCSTRQFTSDCFRRSSGSRVPRTPRLPIGCDGSPSLQRPCPLR
jgi:DNA-binding SARP family transcriptional activator